MVSEITKPSHDEMRHRLVASKPPKSNTIPVISECIFHQRNARGVKTSNFGGILTI